MQGWGRCPVAQASRPATELAARRRQNPPAGDGRATAAPNTWRTGLRNVAAKAGKLFPYQNLGSEFMPPLYEGDLLYMPTTFPGISPTKAREVLQVTDRLIKSFPEVAEVFGKAGRAETATDPAPMDMIETTIRLKPEVGLARRGHQG